jgi:hypothetical protein
MKHFSSPYIEHRFPGDIAEEGVNLTKRPLVGSKPKWLFRSIALVVLRDAIGPTDTLIAATPWRTV